MRLKSIIVGVEVHVELKTNSKMFCGCPADHFGKEPNTQTCPVCLGLPGALPVPNKIAIEKVVLLGLALEARIPRRSSFDRKNYFYPDLPKGYQISQYEQPLVRGGRLWLDSGRLVRLNRIHLEEDTAKLLHTQVASEPVTLIDFNRSGVPLMEIVSEPDLTSAAEVKEYLESVRRLVRYLNISDADMEKGSLRCEPNVNLKISEHRRSYFTPITEIKNINSFRFAQKAVDYEVDRQMQEFQTSRVEKRPGNKQTRGWDENKGITVPRREKEEAADYRYFPEPDIPPIVWRGKELAGFTEKLKAYELPDQIKQRFMSEFGLTAYQAGILTNERDQAVLFEKTVRLALSPRISTTEIANVIINKRAPNATTPEQLIAFIQANAATAVDESKLKEVVAAVLAKNPAVVESYKKGKTQALGVIIGQIKEQTGTVVNPTLIQEVIKTKF